MLNPNDGEHPQKYRQIMAARLRSPENRGIMYAASVNLSGRREPIREVADWYRLPVEVLKAMERSTDPEARLAVRRMACDMEAPMATWLPTKPDERRALDAANQAQADRYECPAVWHQIRRDTDGLMLIMCALALAFCIGIAIFATHPERFPAINAKIHAVVSKNIDK